MRATTGQLIVNRKIVNRSSHEYHMAKAIELAQTALDHGEPPFACILVDADGALCLSEHDRVNELKDMAAHAEATLLRGACRQLNVDTLAGYTLYTTVEPCVMCFTTGWLNGLDSIVFGATMEEIDTATAGQQQEIPIPCREINARSGNRMKIVEGVLKAQCIELFSKYDYTGQ